MTSYLIDDFARRASAPPNLDQNCIFCTVVSGKAPCYKLYEDEHLMAILDIQPIRRGHALVIPKNHVKQLSDLSPELAARLGAAVSRVANALYNALDITGLNVVCNQDYAQAVPHVHYHIVPAPTFSSSEMDPTGKAMLPDAIFFRELQSRGHLDDLEGPDLTERIKCRL
ncbi:hypothetical protein FRC12_016348 [Ceratobasidium sp. 428]|nr:hypothetical protein FRC12_016348 [Ceratobasidium sp. 428]